MIRSVASKVAWVGRTASMVFGLALILALLFGVASMALGANGGNFILGKGKNTATKVTGLIGKVASGSALVVNNPSGGSALGLQVNAGQAPLTVNADAGKATNLDADKLDGKDSTAFLGSGVSSRFAVVAVPDGAAGAANVECADGEHATGGGAALNSFVSDVDIISSRPAVAANAFEQPAQGEPFDAWRATAVNPSGGTGAVNLRAFVVCTT